MPSPLDSIDRLVWDNALTELSQQIGQTEVERWFADTGLSSLRDRTASLVVPSRLHAQWIRSNHLSVLCAVLGVNDCVLTVKEPDKSPIADRPAPPSDRTALNRGSKGAGNGAAKSKFAAPLEAPERLVLNRDYSFENFVVGGANRLAHASALGVADGQARGFNPLFLHGSVGLGKTHLLQAIAHYCLNKNPDCKIIFLSCEQFVNHFIQALQQGDINAFRNRYRSADILVVDDIQLLSNKQRTQEEFFHTFNELHNAHKQIVLASDSPPEEISDLQDRLLSRFKWGMVAEICPPEFETRMAILQNKAERVGLDLPQDVAKFIAENIDNNVRELEGSLTRVHAMASLTNRRVDLMLAKEVLASEIRQRGRAIRIDDILEIVCRHFGAKVGELQSKRRSQSIVFPRQIAMFLARQLTELSLGEIGGFFGGRDHSTVVYALDKMERRRRVDSDFSVTISDLENRIRLMVEEN